jgi:hypothetical protein
MLLLYSRRNEREKRDYKTSERICYVICSFMESRESALLATRPISDGIPLLAYSMILTLHVDEVLSYDLNSCARGFPPWCRIHHNKHARVEIQKFRVLSRLPATMRPRMPWKLRSDVQPDAHQRNQHNIYKVAAQNVLRDGKRKQRIRSSRTDSALDRCHHLRKAVHRAQ